jgi:hypothetical protein
LPGTEPWLVADPATWDTVHETSATEPPVPLFNESVPWLTPPAEATVVGEMGSGAFLYNEGWDLEPAALPSLPATQITAGHLPKFGADGFGITSIDVRHTLLLGYDELPPLNITPGAAVHGWSSPASLDLPSAVYDVYLDFYAQPWQSEAGAVSLGVTPGLYGDFESVDRETFQWSGWLLASRHLGLRWTVLGGVAYVRQLRANWLPIGGAIWTLSDATRFELLFPRPKVTHRFYTDGNWSHWGYIAGNFGGGAWSVADTPQNNVLVGYSDLRLLTGWEAFSSNGYEWRAETGYLFAREINVDNVPLQTPSGTFIAQVSFAF